MSELRQLLVLTCEKLGSDRRLISCDDAANCRIFMMPGGSAFSMSRSSGVCTRKALICVHSSNLLHTSFPRALFCNRTSRPRRTPHTRFCFDGHTCNRSSVGWSDAGFTLYQTHNFSVYGQSKPGGLLFCMLLLLIFRNPSFLKNNTESAQVCRFFTGVYAIH